MQQRCRLLNMPGKGHQLTERHNILKLLEGGDRRSIGRSDEVAALVLVDPTLFAALVEGMWSDQAVVRMRTADAAEKVTRKNPDLLQFHRAEILGLLAEATQPELRWHLAAMLPRLKLTCAERQSAMEHLRGYLDDRSSIVKTFALEAMAELAMEDETLRDEVREMLRESSRADTPAMRARSRKWLRHFED